MEKNFYNDDFEQFLKETADNFRMYPSKRVWNSLYNNLHPGRKWPSLAVCLLLITSIIFLGVAHKNEFTGSTTLAGTGSPVTTFASLEKKTISQAAMPVNAARLNDKVQRPVITPVSNSNNTVIAGSNKSTGFTSTGTTGRTAGQGSLISQSGQQRGENIMLASNNSKAGSNNRYEPVTSNENVNSMAVSRVNSSNDKIGAIGGVESDVAVNADEKDPSTSEKVQEGMAVTDDGLTDKTLAKSGIAIVNTAEANNKETAPATVKAPLVPAAKNVRTVEEQGWIEDYAFHNQPVPSLRTKLLSQIYINPSIGYRSFNKNVGYDFPARSSFSNLTGEPQENPKAVYHDPGLNFEAGYSVLYPYTRSLRLKAGVQLNYTSYMVNAQDLNHSTTTTLLLNDPYSGGIELSERSSTHANNPTEFNQKLNNYTFQVSMPFGADLRIAGRHNLQWFVGATVQPTYVLFGDAYLISSDMKNYVYEPKFLRKWNLNTGLETFLSYTSKAGVTINAGPTFRYQLFSTYTKSYSYDEKLHNVGVKIGLVRSF